MVQVSDRPKPGINASSFLIWAIGVFTVSECENHTSVHTYIHIHTYIHTCVPTCNHPSIHHSLPTYIPTYLPTYQVILAAWNSTKAVKSGKDRDSRETELMGK